MAEERINDIIAQEAFDQLASFGKALNELNEKMKEIIGTAGEVKRAMSSASGFKDVADATAKANEVAKEYTETTRRTQEVQSKMRNVFDSVVSSVDKYDKAIDGARAAMKSAREETGQLLLRVIDEKAAMDATAKSRKDHSKLLKESQDELKGVKSALDGYIAKEKSIRETIAATSAEMEKEREANGKGSERYAELVRKMQSYNDMLQANVAKQQKQVEALNAARESVDRHKDRLVELEIAQSRHRASMSEAQLAAKQSMAIEEQQAGSINELRKQLAQYTSAYNALSEEERKNIEIGVPLAEGMNAIRERLKELNNEQKNAGFAEGSYRQLNAELGSLRNQYKELSEAERENADIGGALQARIQELDTQLKSIDKGIGQYQRNVGNYASIWDDVANGEISFRKAMKTVMIDLQQTEMRRRSLADAIKAQEQALNELSNTEGDNSSAYKDAAAELERLKNEYAECTGQVETMNATLGDLKDVQADVSAMSNAAAADAGNLKAAVAGVGLLTDAYSVLQAGVVALGADSQQLADIYNKVMVLQQGLNSVNKIADALQRESIIRVKARAAIDKIRSVYIEAQTKATVKETAAQAAENAEKTKGAAAAATDAAAHVAETGAKTAETAATFSLTAALQALKVALSSIPIIGWIAGGAAVLFGIVKAINSVMKENAENNKELERRKYILEQTAEVNKKVYSSFRETEEEINSLSRRLNDMERTGESTNELYSEMASKLGVTVEYLREHRKELGKMLDEYKGMAKAKTEGDALLNQAVEIQTKMSESVEDAKVKVQSGEKDAREAFKEIAKEAGMTKTEIKNALKEVEEERQKRSRQAAEGITNESQRQKAYYTEYSKNATLLFDRLNTFAANNANVFREKADEKYSQYDKFAKNIEERARQAALKTSKYEVDQYENFSDFLENIVKANTDHEKKAQLKTLAGTKKYYSEQKAEALKLAKTEEEMAQIVTYYDNLIADARESFTKKGQKAADSAAEYYRSVLKQLADFEDKQMNKTVRGRLSKLDEHMVKELGKYKLTEEQKSKVAELYSKRRQEILDEENARVNQSIAAAYAVQVETRLKMMEDEARRRGLQGKELSELLISIENERFAQEQKNRDEAFKKETKDLVEGGEEYVAIRKKYDALYEKAVFEHEAKLGDIRGSGIDGEFEKIRQAYKNLINELTIQRGGGELTEIERLEIAANQSHEELEKFESMTTEQFDTVRQLYEDGIITQEDYASKTESILKGVGLSMAQYYAKLAELRANDAKSQKEADEAKMKSIIASANVISDSFASIGDSLQQLTGESVGMTIAMQSIAMAQVMANQAVAISAAIEKAFDSPTAVNVMMAIATATAGVAAVIAQMVSAKSAIEQSRQALSNVNAYAEGTSHHPGGDAVVGEGGKPELVVAGNKTFVVEKPTLIRDLPVGAKVTPLDARSIDNYPQVDLSEVLASMDRIERKDRVHIDVGRNVYAYIVKGASRARVLNKQFSH